MRFRFLLVFISVVVGFVDVVVMVVRDDTSYVTYVYYNRLLVASVRLSSQLKCEMRDKDARPSQPVDYCSNAQLNAIVRGSEKDDTQYSSTILRPSVNTGSW